MLKHFLLVFLFSFSVLNFAQSHSLTVGYESSVKYGEVITAGYDFIAFEKRDKSFSIGVEFGNTLVDPLLDMTGYIGFNEYPEEFTNSYKTVVWNKYGVKFGYEIGNNIIFSFFGGYNNIKKFGVFESRAINEYWVNTNEKLNPFGYRISIEFIASAISPKIGFGSNGIFLGVGFLTGSKKLNRYFKDKKLLSQSKNISIAGNEISDVNLFDLRAMIDVFIDDCKAHNININTNKIESTFMRLPRGTLAIADGMDIEGEINLRVDPNQWQNASPSKKWYVLYHELGHDYLNLKHGEGGKMMFNYVDREYSWEEFKENKEYMFEAYKRLNPNK
jgi:hypothetical protein